MSRIALLLIISQFFSISFAKSLSYKTTQEFSKATQLEEAVESYVAERIKNNSYVELKGKVNLDEIKQASVKNFLALLQVSLSQRFTDEELQKVVSFLSTNEGRNFMSLHNSGMYSELMVKAFESEALSNENITAEVMSNAYAAGGVGEFFSTEQGLKFSSSGLPSLVNIEIPEVGSGVLFFSYGTQNVGVEEFIFKQLLRGVFEKPKEPVIFYENIQTEEGSWSLVFLDEMSTLKLDFLQNGTGARPPKVTIVLQPIEQVWLELLRPLRSFDRPPNKFDVTSKKSSDEALVVCQYLICNNI